MVAKKKVAEGAPKKISEGGGGNGLFPRGGGDSLAAVERKRLRLEAQAEAARDFAEDQQSGKVVKKRREAGEDEVCSATAAVSRRSCLAGVWEGFPWVC